MTAKDRLKTWLLTKQYVKTSEIACWGAMGGLSNRAMRNARVLANGGFLRRLNRQETQKIFGRTSELAYHVIGEIKEIKYVSDKTGQLGLAI